MRKIPKLSRMLYNDYLLFLSATGTIILAIFGVYLLLVEKEMVPGLIIALISALLLGIFILRLLSLRNLFLNGVETDAVITRIGFYRDRGRIEFTYILNGKQYQTGMAIMKNKLTKTLETDMQVKVLVNPDRLRQSVIKDIYY